MAPRHYPRDRSGSEVQNRGPRADGLPCLAGARGPMHFDAARPRPGARTRSELADVFLTLAAANAAAGRAESAIWHLLVLFYAV